MNYCKLCVQPDSRPGIYFKDGICGACLSNTDIKTIDWNSRLTELLNIANEAKNKNSVYDCAIGVSGGKDSTFQALYARDVLKLRPLLVNCEPDGITEIGVHNIENLKNLGFDTISIRPNPIVMKKLMKKDFYEFLNPVKVTEFALYASTYILADKFDIPLIIQGENPGLTLGVRNTGVSTDGDSLKANTLNTLSTGWERYIGDGITEKDLFLFHYDVNSLRNKGIKGIWLGYYVKEWSPSYNTKFSTSNGLKIRDKFNPNSIGTYKPNFQLDSDIVQVNQLLKYIKFGFGQCTDHACYDIREGLITREEAFELVKKYDGKCSTKYIKKLCDHIDITIDEFWKVANSFRGEMWELKNRKWILK